MDEVLGSEQIDVVILVQLLGQQQAVGLVELQNEGALHLDKAVAREHEAEAGLADINITAFDEVLESIDRHLLLFNLLSTQQRVKPKTDDIH